MKPAGSGSIAPMCRLNRARRPSGEGSGCLNTGDVLIDHAAKLFGLA